MDTIDLNAWVEGYVRAWESNDPGEIAGLFADDAVYYTEPFREPWRGQDEIVAQWLERKDEPGSWRFTYKTLAVVSDIGFVQGRTVYANPPKAYANLWIIRLDTDGRCNEFTEWWMEET